MVSQKEEKNGLFHRHYKSIALTLYGSGIMEHKSKQARG
jgi:hypothetical protein